MRFVRVFVFSLSLVCGPAGHAGVLWDSRGFASYSGGLPLASDALLRKITKNYWEALRSRTNLDLGKIRVAKFEDIDPWLERASQSDLGTLDLFTQPALADPSAAALLLDGPTLRRITEKYELSSMWMISTPTLLADRRPMLMDYMIIGQGKLIIGYPYESRVEVISDDKLVECLYEPFISANIVNGPSRRGIYDVKVLRTPFGQFEPFRGPMGASINSFRLDGNSVVVNYSLGFDQETRTQRTPIVFKRTHLAQLFDGHR